MKHFHHPINALIMWNSLCCFFLVTILLLSVNVLLGSEISIRSYNLEKKQERIDETFKVSDSKTPFLPILMLHGVTSNNNSMSDLKKNLLKYVPEGTFIYSVPCMDSEESLLTTMMEQVEDFATQVKELQKLYNFTNYHLICHSQGGLICRAFIQMYPNHGVKVFISLSGVQNGEYGIPGILSWEQYWRKNFPFLWNITKEEAYLIFYTNYFQEKLSVANYWKDPYHFEEYRQFNQFLTIVNNDSLTVDYASKYQFRSNFLQIDKMVLTAGPDDEVIKPYYSAIFGFYKLGSNGNDLEQSLMPEQSVYTNDVFGLKTLEAQKRLFIEVVPGVNHIGWIEREDLMVKYMLPYLY